MAGFRTDAPTIGRLPFGNGLSTRIKFEPVPRVIGRAFAAQQHVEAAIGRDIQSVRVQQDHGRSKLFQRAKATRRELEQQKQCVAARDRKAVTRSEELRIGKESFSTWRLRWEPHHYKKKQENAEIL